MKSPLDTGGNEMQSLLASVGKHDVKADPFPHIVVADALDDHVCDQLQAEFPPLDVITNGEPASSNKRFGLSAPEVRDNPRVTPSWKDFIGYHSSRAFLDELVELFGDHIRTAYPDFEAEHGSLESLRSGVRNADSFDDYDVLMDAQISMNTPVVAKPNSVRRAHLDSPSKLFAGLFYLRRPGDTSEGGDLELYRFRGRARGFRGEAPYETFLEVAETVPYRRNMLVMFLNSPASVHGVTVRSRTDVPRCFVNLVAAVEKPLFDLGPIQATLPDKFMAGPEIVSRKIRKIAVGSGS